MPSSTAAFGRWVVANVLDPSSPLSREGRYLLAEEPSLTDRALYHPVLTAIAEGRTRVGQIAQATGRPVTGLAHALNTLEAVRLVVREQDALRQRRSTYRIGEPILRFHHAVMRPHWARLERGNAPRVWHDVQASFASLVFGPHFEDLAREWTRTYASPRTVGGEVTDVAQTVVHDPNACLSYQVDVVGLAAGRRDEVVVLGEAKWGTAGVDVATRLERVRTLLGRVRADVSTTKLLVFARRFTNGLRKLADEGAVTLVDLDRLYRGD